MTESVDEVPRFPFPDGPQGSPPHEYAERRARCPFGEVQLPSGDRGVLLVTYRDVAAAMSDPRLSHNLTAPGSPRVMRGPSALDDPEFILNKEGPDHLRLRRIIAATFTPRAIERWKPVIRATARELIDDMEKQGGPLDLVRAYGLALPIRIICQLMGVPERDADRFRTWSMALASAVVMEPAERGRRMVEFMGYVRELIAERRREPQDFLLDSLIAARDGEDKLTEAELENLVLSLIGAGNETTSNVLGKSFFVLLRDDAVLWRSLAADPGLVPSAVAEMLRYNPLGNGGSLRLATERVTLPSGTVEKGQAVFVATASAMRDETVYDEPDTVRLDRDAPPVLAFGAGPHYCVGAYLARAEIGIALEQLSSRLPGLRLAVEPEEVRFTGGDLMRPVEALPVTW
ncbi:Cytochrome P450 [Frankia canadensis]|uniref:Cytochrome P450 n=1 Tax=Frankia canadensis TaxID=1836972 RepID=A0A2I2KRS0_9ACTN|nr:cytochrome P450 [Frankia canadensis]SNQ48336.1 Cytochrome P450 [Frankia canadensis]SOU55626.1 Cytochrome P450 [Frankia canadensis]